MIVLVILREAGLRALRPPHPPLFPLHPLPDPDPDPDPEAASVLSVFSDPVFAKGMGEGDLVRKIGRPGERRRFRV